MAKGKVLCCIPVPVHETSQGHMQVADRDGVPQLHLISDHTDHHGRHAATLIRHLGDGVFEARNTMVVGKSTIALSRGKAGDEIMTVSVRGQPNQVYRRIKA